MSKVPNWLNLSRSAPARLALLRAAGDGDWKAVRLSRGGTFDNAQSYYGDFGAGTQSDGSRIWNTFTGEKFRSEKDAADSEEAPSHVRRAGEWYTDEDCTETAKGIIARLPHGRFIAGYYWGSNGERVYFDETYTDEREACMAANEHARVFAELSQEDSAKYNAAQRLEGKIEDSLVRLRECIALRHKDCMSYVRGEIGELIATIRDSRETLASEYKDYV